MRGTEVIIKKLSLKVCHGLERRREVIAVLQLIPCLEAWVA